MALQFTLTLSPNKQATKLDVVKTTTVVDPATNEVFIAIGDTVNTGRQVEAINALKLLSEKVRESKVLDTGGAVVVSAVDIDNINHTAIRTGVNLVGASVTTDDAVIGIGAGMLVLLGNQYLVILEVAFKILRDSMKENAL